MILGPVGREREKDEDKTRREEGQASSPRVRGVGGALRHVGVGRGVEGGPFSTVKIGGGYRDPRSLKNCVGKR